MMQIPTPTPFPQVNLAEMPIQMPSGFTFWAFADETVGWWNRIGAERTVILQWVIVLLIVFSATFFIARMVRSLSQERNVE